MSLYLSVCRPGCGATLNSSSLPVSAVGVFCRMDFLQHGGTLGPWRHFTTPVACEQTLPVQYVMFIVFFCLYFVTPQQEWPSQFYTRVCFILLMMLMMMSLIHIRMRYLIQFALQQTDVIIQITIVLGIFAVKLCFLFLR